MAGSAGQVQADLAAITELRQRLDEVADQLAQKVRDVSQREEQVTAMQEAWDRDRAAQQAKLDEERASVEAERAAWEEEKRRMTAPAVRGSDIVALNIGGEKFVQRRRSTLCAVEDSLLALRFSGRWEQDADRDAEGRFFINASPELFMPILDYLGTKEIEDPDHPTPWPEAPDRMQSQFQAMLRFFLNLPSAPAVRELHALPKRASLSISGEHGLAFQATAKAHSLSITAFLSSSSPVEVVVFACEGPLSERISGRDVWSEVGRGTLQPKSAFVLNQPVLCRAGTPICIYIHSASSNFSVANVTDKRAVLGAVARENAELKVHYGCFSTSSEPFVALGSTRGLGAFPGTLMYTLLA